MVYKTELRIGNLLWLNASFSGYFLVNEITDEGICFTNGNVVKFSEIEPVLLTPDFLIKAHFVFGRIFCDSDFYDLKLKKDFLGNEAWEFKRNNEKIKEVQYVHQIQNLYYALSGEELKIVF